MTSRTEALSESDTDTCYTGSLRLPRPLSTLLTNESLSGYGQIRSGSALEQVLNMGPGFPIDNIGYMSLADFILLGEFFLGLAAFVHQTPDTLHILFG